MFEMNIMENIIITKELLVKMTRKTLLESRGSIEAASKTQEEINNDMDAIIKSGNTEEELIEALKEIAARGGETFQKKIIEFDAYLESIEHLDDDEYFEKRDAKRRELFGE